MKIRLEAYTERSESNPGQSLGTTNINKEAVWKTVPLSEKYQTICHLYLFLIKVFHVTCSISTNVGALSLRLVKLKV